MKFVVKYRDGHQYAAESFEEIKLGEFSARGIECLTYSGVACFFGPREQTIAHRMRRSWKVGEMATKDHYCLMTNARRVFVFPDGKFAVMVESGQRDALFREFALSMEEWEYAMQNTPVDQVQVDKST